MQHLNKKKEKEKRELKNRYNRDTALFTIHVQKYSLGKIERLRLDQIEISKSREENDWRATPKAWKVYWNHAIHLHGLRVQLHRTAVQWRRSAYKKTRLGRGYKNECFSIHSSRKYTGWMVSLPFTKKNNNKKKTGNANMRRHINLLLKDITSLKCTTF